MDIEYKEITIEQLEPNMLKDFNRYQKVQKDWEKKGEELILETNPHIEDWNEEDKTRKVMCVFKTILENGGELFGAFHGGKLIGFSGFDGIFLGSKNQYLQLSELHVSYEYRGRKIGRELFNLCVHAALKHQCKKFYIVASSSEDSQEFYRRTGCIDTEELIPHLFDEDPFDIHMEYMINR